jgi:hypothetical protein
MISEVTSNHECIIRPYKKEKPVDVSTGRDSNIVSPEHNDTVGRCKLSPEAIFEIKRLATDSDRGRAIKWLLAGKMVMTRNDECSYIWIASLRSKLNRIAGSEIVCKAKVRDKTGRPRMGYYLTCPGMFKD